MQLREPQKRVMLEVAVTKVWMEFFLFVCLFWFFLCVCFCLFVFPSVKNTRDLYPYSIAVSYGMGILMHIRKVGCSWVWVCVCVCACACVCVCYI